MGKFFTEKRKRELIFFIILWLILTIVFVLPISVAGVNSFTASGKFDTPAFVSNFTQQLISIESRIDAFKEPFIDNTMTCLRNFSVFYFVVALILMLKKDKGKYHDIEHGSSDWSEGGEQYKVLSRNKGIILAEHNYLPVDKPGNVNVLIVGRIRCW